VHPGCGEANNSYILIETACKSGFCDSKDATFNPLVDLPFKSSEDLSSEGLPASFLCLPVICSETNSVVALVQLMTKKKQSQHDTSLLSGTTTPRHSNQSGRFTPTDLNLLGQVSNQMGGVCRQIGSAGSESPLTPGQIKGLFRFRILLGSKVAGLQKQFFLELLAIRWGKTNLLKNKILRKHLDDKFNLDSKLRAKVERMIEVRQKHQKRAQSKALEKLSFKINKVQAQRQKNAASCLKVLTKFQKLLSLRVKETAFKSWTKSSPGTYRGSCLSEDETSMMECSSVLSTFYLKAKALYSLRKIFDQRKVRVEFDKFVLKTVRYPRRAPDNRVRVMLLMGKMLNKHTQLRSKVAFHQFRDSLTKLYKTNRKLR
jgi:hypothetical protein